MKVLFIGGTGNISSSASRLALARGIDLYHLNRGATASSAPGVKTLIGNIYDPGVASVLNGHTWDAVVDWIAYEEKNVRHDFDLFNGRTKQFIFISSASAYQKPSRNPVITESTPLENPFWEYSRNKIACERVLNELYRNSGFPVTIVRPSHTYDTIIPATFGGSREYTVVDRMRRGKKIIVHGDGSSLWVLTHADDFAKAFVGLLGNPRAIGESFHITSDEVLSWDQIHRTLAEACGGTADIVHIASDLLAAFNPDLVGNLIGDKATSVIFDNSKIKSVVPDFKATIPFSEGIRRTLDWFHADPSRQIIRQETNEWIDSVIARYGTFINQ